MLDSYFHVKELGSSVRTEVLAGLTTFLTLAYIIFVNPAILSTAGMDRDAVFVATCLAAATGTLIMGLYANYPIALAPGMGLNAFFTYTVVGSMGYHWRVALGAVFVSAVLFLILSLLPVREWIINSIPRSQKLAISAGIGLFLGIIALQGAGIVVDHPVTLVTMGDLGKGTVLLAFVGFVLMVALDYRGIPGAIIIGILAVTVAGIMLGLSPAPARLVSPPPSIAPTFLALDLAAALEIGLVTIIFTFLIVDLFDTAGTLIGLAHRAGLLDSQGRLPRLRRALIADSGAAIVGAALGTSTTTCYIESAAGIREGGRTGLTAVTVAVLFLLALFLAPVAGAVPEYATAPAIFFVACIMVRGLAEIDWEDITESVPAVVTAIAMPLTYSIATGIGFGFIAYAGIKLLSGRLAQATPSVLFLAAVFVLKFALI